ncbi:MAG: hypothetical protein WBD67_09510 [Terracidiphilus sp.]
MKNWTTPCCAAAPARSEGAWMDSQVESLRIEGSAFPHLKIEMWGTHFLAEEKERDLSHPPADKQHAELMDQMKAMNHELALLRGGAGAE